MGFLWTLSLRVWSRWSGAVPGIVCKQLDFLLFEPMTKVIGPSLLSYAPFGARLDGATCFFVVREVDPHFAADLILNDPKTTTWSGFNFRLLLSQSKVNTKRILHILREPWHLLALGSTSLFRTGHGLVEETYNYNQLPIKISFL